MDNLCVFFEKALKINDEKDEFNEMIEIARCVDYNLDNFNVLDRNKHEILLDNIADLFSRYKKIFIDGYETNEDDYETPKMKIRARAIKNAISTYLSEYKNPVEKIKLFDLMNLARTIFIQLYYLIRSDLDKYPDSKDIYDYLDYEKIVKFI